MIKKRLIAGIITLLIMVAMVVIPAFASSYYYNKSGVTTYNDYLVGYFTLQHAYPAGTSTEVRSMFPAYSGYYKYSYYYEESRDSSGNYHLLYSDGNGGVSSIVKTDPTHTTMNSNTKRRTHVSYLHQSSYSSSAVMEYIGTQVT